MIRSSLLILCFGFSFVFNANAGGPWTNAKNQLYAQISYNIIPESRELFHQSDPDLSLILPRAITDQTVGLYGEYGITDKFTIIASIPYKLTSNSDDLTTENNTGLMANKGSLNGLGNIELTGKYQFYNNNIVMAADIKFSLPTAQDNIKTRLSTGYQTFAIQPGFNIGYSKGKFYGFSRLGYNFRNDLTDEYRVDLELGYKVFKEFYVILALDVLKSTEELANANPPLDFTTLYFDQQEYSSVTLKLSSKVYKNMGVNLNLTLAAIQGNYVQSSPSIGGSIYMKF